ncbi:MAG: energy transducer TonB [Flavobacteriales bacterium]|jgi:periplasmic protein TonB|nr:energy transducer TonB [Flavobacteriales bacterium]
MTFLDTTYKKKSAVITSIILVLLILSLFVFGLQYLDPPKEYGIAVNFGTADIGKGDIQTKDIPKTTPTKVKVQQKKAEPIVEKEVQTKEKILTQDKIDAPVIAKTPVKKKKPLVKKPVPVIKKVVPKPDKSTTDALSKLINGTKNTEKAKTGEGTDNKPGNKGKNDGDLNTKTYYGKGSNGGGGNYNLGNRKPIFTPKPIYDCNEEGLVVVSIEVDNLGNVINANAGVKGSTNSAPCLLERAKAAALQTTWQPDASAPNKQIGSIIYNFSLTN